jgi:hypothetical protein
VRAAPLLAVLVAACGPGVYHAPPTGSDQGIANGAELAPDDDGTRPPYNAAALETALIAERGKEAHETAALSSLEEAAELDPTISPNTPRLAAADLEVRRRYIKTLESCQASGHACPPRLDEPAWKWDTDPEPGRDKPPPLDTPLRFDRDSWLKITAELHGRACACRNMACVDGVGVAIDQLETRPMLAVQSDDTAIAAITAARECLFRLRGKEVAKHTAAPTDDL